MQAAVASALTRLHIAPLTPTLLSAYIPPSLLSSARNISYHTLETFPERSYGFVELPAMEADKLKKKLNGSILKGTKVSVEDARPEKKRKAEDGEDKESRRKAKKAKGGKNVISGVELPNGRKVKRGWTEMMAERKLKKEKKKAIKREKRAGRIGKPSKYSKGPEMLFKTGVPGEKPRSTKNKDKYDKNKRKKKGQTVVHEFEKTVKHASFLKSNEVAKDGKVTSEYVEGKGWVDNSGKVIEEEHKKPPKNGSGETRYRTRSSTDDKAKVAQPLTTRPAKDAPEDEIATSSSDSSNLSDSSVISSSSSEDSEDSDDSGDSDADSDSSSAKSVDSAFTKHKSATLDSSSSPLKSSSKPVTAEAKIDKASKRVGPDLSVQEGFTASSTALEALYKRPSSSHSNSTPKPAPIVTSFNFFEGDAASGDENDSKEGKKEPHTPFTRRDREWRGLRSAAPTPDTAAVNKRFFFPSPEDEDEEEDDDDEKEGDDAGKADGKLSEAQSSADKVKEAAEGESEFSKWFWENRGENNRAWKKNRREALKTKRQRENRRLGRRIV